MTVEARGPTRRRVGGRGGSRAGASLSGASHGDSVKPEGSGRPAGQIGRPAGQIGPGRARRAHAASARWRRPPGPPDVDSLRIERSAGGPRPLTHDHMMPVITSPWADAGRTAAAEPHWQRYH
jgi:hypothetical protein